MVTKIKQVHPFERIEEWSIHKYGISLYLNHWNPEWFKDGETTLDIEHDGKENFVGLGLSNGKLCVYISELSYAKQITIPKFIAHNGISDIKCLKQWGFKVDESYLFWDTMLMQHILDSSQRMYGLKDICSREFGAYWPNYKEIVKIGKEYKTLNDFPVGHVAEYNACDTYWTYQLYKKQKKYMLTCPPFIADGAEINYFKDLEKPCAKIFQDMSDRGIRIDLHYLEELKVHLEDEINPLKEKIYNETGEINLDSPKQLLEALHKKDIFPEYRGKASTDKRALERLKSNNLVSNLLSYSELSTLLSNFVYPYLERKEEIVHPYFNQVGTRTGRVSCSNPNLLQIPKRTENGKLVRRMFIPRDGFLFGDCDFGQIEPRIMAHLSEDAVMCKMFNDGTDFHTFTAERLSIDRERAKVLNLSVGYRATFKSVSQQLKCTDQEAQVEIDAWWKMFPELRLWQDKLIWQSKKDSYFTTLLGRRIKVEGLGEYNKGKREHAQRQLINNICQASAAEVMKKAMIKVSESPYVDILVQVYDELLFEFEKNDIEYESGVLEDTQKCMKNCIKLDVPLVVEAKMGENWAEIR